MNNLANILIIEDEKDICETMVLALSTYYRKERIFPNIANLEEFYSRLKENLKDSNQFYEFITKYIYENQINYIIIDLHLKESDDKSNYKDTMGFKLIEDLVVDKQPQWDKEGIYLQEYFALPKLIISNHKNLISLKEEYSYFVTDIFEKINNISRDNFIQFIKDKNLESNINFSVRYFKNIQNLNKGDKVMGDKIVNGDKNSTTGNNSPIQNKTINSNQDININTEDLESIRNECENLLKQISKENPENFQLLADIYNLKSTAEKSPENKKSLFDKIENLSKTINNIKSSETYLLVINTGKTIWKYGKMYLGLEED